MPSVVVTRGAGLGLERCRRFLSAKSKEAAVRAGQVISQHLALLETSPEVGRPLNEEPEMRELVIPFGSTGYVALYRYEPEVEIVYLLAFRHQKEAGF